MDKSLLQELEYGRLLTQRVTDLTQWRAVHRLLPEHAPVALKTAALRLGWGVMIDQLLLMTETPAQTATRLGGLIAYDEGLETAVFSLCDSAEIFGARYPTWHVQVDTKEAEPA